MAYTASSFNLVNGTAADHARFAETVAYLSRDMRGAGLLDQLASKHTPISFNNEGNDSFNPNTGILNWDSTAAHSTNNPVPYVSGVQSAALALYHEGVHATDPLLMWRMGQADSQYENAAERYATEQSNIVANNLGESARYTHSFAPVVRTGNSTEHGNPGYTGDGPHLFWSETEADGSVTNSPTAAPYAPSSAPDIYAADGIDNGTTNWDDDDIDDSDYDWDEGDYGARRAGHPAPPTHGGGGGGGGHNLPLRMKASPAQIAAPQSNLQSLVQSMAAFDGAGDSAALTAPARGQFDGFAGVLAASVQADHRVAAFR